MHTNQPDHAQPGDQHHIVGAPAQVEEKTKLTRFLLVDGLLNLSCVFPPSLFLSLFDCSDVFMYDVYCTTFDIRLFLCFFLHVCFLWAIVSHT